MTMEKGAIISECGKHRYSLWRIWDVDRPIVMFIGLNPSRADAVITDPTITRCVQFAINWNYGGMYFANLFSWRSPYPEDLVTNLNLAVGPECDDHLLTMIDNAEKVVLCWGSWPFISERASKVISLIEDPYCFGLNKDGNPKHPLYLKASSELQPFIK
jgi:hypothetical protein